MAIYKYKDVRKSLVRDTKRGPLTRSVSRITYLVIHHSATKQGLGGSNAEGYARYHVKSLGWRNIAYAYVIEPDGTTKHCLDHNVIGAHVGQHNSYSIGVCLTGDFRHEEPTQEQEKALRAIVAHLKKAIPSIKYVRGHQEMPGYSWKNCPAFDYKAVMAGSDAEPNPFDQYKPEELKPAPNGARFTRTLKEGMKGGKDIAAVQKRVGVVVDEWYGPKTKAAVLDFQEKAGAKKPSGAVGDWTWAKMFGLAEPAPVSTLHRVIVDGTQVGAYGEHENVANAVVRHLSNSKEIKIERV